ncbi:hypothetical protein Scep_004937 [Stephania cephalantha]|uniref:Uncharacterized protein n=1 Tax=Stephania cephalantha TaxID=152367 RepID=A0AAP0PVV7_9MAGN
MSLFDAIVDAVYSALEKTGDDVVMLENSQTYDQNLIKQVRRTFETPKRPGKSLETYLFALFNEDLKPEGTEQNFGLYHHDMTEVRTMVLQSSLFLKLQDQIRMLTLLYDTQISPSATTAGDSPRPPPETRRTADAPSLLVSRRRTVVARKARSAAEASRRRRLALHQIRRRRGKPSPPLVGPLAAAARTVIRCRSDPRAAGRSCAAFRGHCAAFPRSLRRHPPGRIAPSQLEGYPSRRPPPHRLRNLHRRWLGPPPPPPLLGPTPPPLVAQASSGRHYKETRIDLILPTHWQFGSKMAKKSPKLVIWVSWPQGTYPGAGTLSSAPTTIPHFILGCFGAPSWALGCQDLNPAHILHLSRDFGPLKGRN